MIYYSNIKYLYSWFQKAKITLKTCNSSIINKLNYRCLVNRMHNMVGGAD
jgi:hypothetical protein